MTVYCFGLNHLTAPLDLREKLSWEEDKLRHFLETQAAHPEIEEIAVLSTCNRVEVYFVSQAANFGKIAETLSEFSAVPSQELIQNSYELTGSELVEHLFCVASGLDSLLLGEPQILGQVARAYEFAQSCGTSGKGLSKLFQAALSCGKRVQTETTINQHTSSIPSLAVKLASKEHPDLSKAHIMLVGAGEMAEIAMQAFQKRGASKFTVVSRTLKSAQSLAKKWNAHADTIENLPKLLSEVDVVLSSSSAQGFIIGEAMLKESLDARSQKSLVILDIAVPRDVDFSVRRLPDVKLYDMDDLQQRAEQFRTLRNEQAKKAEGIIDNEAGNFQNYLDNLNFVPLIKDLRRQAETIRKAELQRALQRLPGLDAAQEQQINRLTQSIVQKILHPPTTYLRQEAASKNGDRENYAEWARELFGLSSE